MKTRCNLQKVKNLSLGCPCLQSPFLWGQVLLLGSSNRCCRKLSYQLLLGVLRCFPSCLFVKGLLPILKQLRSVKLFISQQYNLLKLTIITLTRYICQYTQTKPCIFVPVACFWLLQCDALWAPWLEQFYGSRATQTLTLSSWGSQPL